RWPRASKPPPRPGPRRRCLAGVRYFAAPACFLAATASSPSPDSPASAASLAVASVAEPSLAVARGRVAPPSFLVPRRVWPRCGGRAEGGGGGRRGGGGGWARGTGRREPMKLSGTQRGNCGEK